MRRSSAWMCRIGFVALVGMIVGCNAADGHRWTMPWQKPLAKEEFQVPPMADNRYSEPATLPKQVMRTGIKPKSDVDLARNPPPGMGGPGNMGVGRASMPGG